jgi:hypothetical protein
VNHRDERVAKNQGVLRAVNREIEQASEELGSSELEVLCECGREGCSSLISLPTSEYEQIHAESDRFIVIPGHETPEVENVVERKDGYLIVDKFGEAEKAAEEAENS